mgnify:CR=1 FL=1
MKEVLCFGLLRWSLGWSGLLLAAFLSCAPGARGTRWGRLSRHLGLVQETVHEALGDPDCPAGLMGAFHQGKQALLMCGNNLQDDPAQVWVVLAHESAHVMQDCKGEYLMPPGLLAEEMDQARRTHPAAFLELQLYDSSQHHAEAEARLVQVLPPNQVEALFVKHCSNRLSP